MGRQKLTSARQESCTTARPKRKATNSHIFRYLQTRNPVKLEENDLRRALEASLEECPDFWPEDTASCSSSDQSNATSASCSSSTGGGCNLDNRKTIQRYRNTSKDKSTNKRKSKSSSMQHNHLCNSNNHCLNHHHSTNSYANCTANHHHPQCKCCPSTSVHNRYKPVAKKNIYNEADFFHDGIMEYIEFELMEKDIIKRKRKAIE